MRRLIFSFPLGVLLSPALALAQDATPDGVRTTEATPSREVTRPFLYVDDPSIPSQGHTLAAISETYSGNDRSASRAFSSTDTGPGGKFAVGAQVGLYKTLALDATGVLGGFGSGVGGGLMGGLRFAPFDGAKHGFRVALAAGYLLDLDQASGFYGRGSLAYDIGRVRVGSTFQAERVMRTGQDNVDLMVTAGASVRVHPMFRLGAEYIVQDLEEAFVTADAADAPRPGVAEGGAHQFASVTGSLELLHRRLFINLGPALALNYQTGVKPVGRAVISYAF